MSEDKTTAVGDRYDDGYEAAVQDVLGILDDIEKGLRGDGLEDAADYLRFHLQAASQDREEARRGLSRASLGALKYLGYPDPENAPETGPRYYDEDQWFVRPADLVSAIEEAQR